MLWVFVKRRAQTKSAVGVAARERWHRKSFFFVLTVCVLSDILSRPPSELMLKANHQLDGRADLRPAHTDFCKQEALSRADIKHTPADGEMAGKPLTEVCVNWNV